MKADTVAYTNSEDSDQFAHSSRLITVFFVCYEKSMRNSYSDDEESTKKTLQSNLNGSNIFGTMEIRSKHG